MTWLTLLLVIKITVTGLLVAIPFLVLSSARLERMTGIRAQRPTLFRLYGVAIIALLVGYGFGIPVAQAGVFPWGVVWMGLVSNGGASWVLWRHGRDQGLNRYALGFFGSITILLLLATFFPEVALTRAW